MLLVPVFPDSYIYPKVNLPVPDRLNLPGKIKISPGDFRETKIVEKNRENAAVLHYSAVIHSDLTRKNSKLYQETFQPGGSTSKRQTRL